MLWLLVWDSHFENYCCKKRGFPDGSAVKNPPAVKETWVRSLIQEDPLEEEMGTDSSILAWKIPRTEELGGLQSAGLQGVRHDWETKRAAGRLQRKCRSKSKKMSLGLTRFPNSVNPPRASRVWHSSHRIYVPTQKGNGDVITLSTFWASHMYRHSVLFNLYKNSVKYLCLIGWETNTVKAKFLNILPQWGQGWTPDLTTVKVGLNPRSSRIQSAGPCS